MAAPGLSPAQLADMRAHISEDQGPRNVVVCSLLIGISTTAVILRLISRYVSPFKLWWDDFFCVLGLVGNPSHQRALALVIVLRQSQHANIHSQMTACGFAGDAIYRQSIHCPAGHLGTVQALMEQRLRLELADMSSPSLPTTSSRSERWVSHPRSGACMTDRADLELPWTRPVMASKSSIP